MRPMAVTSPQTGIKMTTRDLRRERFQKPVRLEAGEVAVARSNVGKVQFVLTNRNNLYRISAESIRKFGSYTKAQYEDFIYNLNQE